MIPQIGSLMPILYDPADPYYVYEDAFMGTLAVSIIPFIVGVGFIFVSWFSRVCEGCYSFASAHLNSLERVHELKVRVVFKDPFISSSLVFYH